MGYELTRFTSNINSQLCCRICKMVLEDPVQSPCEHVFCSKCIKTWLEDYPNCPVDRRSLSFDDLKPTPRFFRNLLDELEIKCDFAVCKKSIKFEHLKSHLITCKHNPYLLFKCKSCNINITPIESKITHCFYHLQKRLKFQNAIIETLIYDVENKDEVIAELQDKVNWENEVFEKLNYWVKRKDDEIANLDDMIALKNEKFNKLYAFNSFRQSFFKPYQRDLNMPKLSDIKDDVVQAKNIVGNQASVRGTDKGITKLNDEDNLGKLKDLKDEVNSKEKDIAKFNRELNRKYEQITKLKDEIYRQTEEIQDLHDVIKKKGDEIPLLKKEVHLRDEDIMVLNDNIYIQRILCENLSKLSAKQRHSL